jgi:hypothetical protein
MARPGRNAPCPCGSGRKVKRCCQERKGPDEVQLARVFLRTQGEAARRALVDGHDEEELAEHFQALAELPAKHDELVIRLPSLMLPALQSLRRALRDDDEEAGRAVLPDAVATVDSPLERARLANVVIALRTADRLHPCVAAAALADLSLEDSLLVSVSLLRALRIETGRCARASSLVLAR